MIRSLYAKLALVLMGLFLAVAIFMVYLTTVSTTLYNQEINQKLNYDVAKHIVSEIKLMENDSVNQDALKQLFHQLMVFNPSIEIYLLDKTGRILSYSAPPGKVKLERVSIEPIRSFLDGDQTIPLRGDDPRGLEREKVFSAWPIKENNILQGYLYVILGGEEYDNVIHMLEKSYILNITTWTIVAGLLFSLVAGLLLFGWLTARLRRLSQAIQVFKNKGSNVQTDILQHIDRPADEIDQLNNRFLEMSQQIAGYIAELKEADNLRRDLVANVSHDLRTPLATLQGYIESLSLKKSQLSEAEQTQYLNIALQHCQRLNALVQELFELAKLDAKETILQTEPFNLRELVHDVVQKFMLKAEEKQLDLAIVCDEQTPFIRADIAMIERVFENLLENAIRHTPAGGTVKVSIIPRGNHIAVELRDTGLGIPQDELPHIFDRFYKVDKSRNKETLSSGLGLAISKRILELHNSDINVDSNEEKGTVFSFQLPLYAAN